MQMLSTRLAGVMPRGLAFSAVLALLLPLASGAWAQTPTALPPLADDTQSQASAINPRGEVAGFSRGSGVVTAVVWDRNGTATALPPLAGDFASFATAINPRGEVAGISQDASFLLTAVLWDLGATPTALPPLAGDTDSFASAINPRGEVAGVSLGSGGFTAVVWR